jgi:hypothetical protein
MVAPELFRGDVRFSSLASRAPSIHDPTAAAIAQSNAAAQNDAMIASTIEAGRKNLTLTYYAFPEEH